MPNPECQLLLIDDDNELGELLAKYLSPEGFAIDAVETGELGVERALAGDHRLIILDVMLPGIDGFETLRRIRAHSLKPVLMLAKAIGRPLDDVLKAFTRARSAQAVFVDKRKRIGLEALKTRFDRAVVVIGRPYNTYDPFLNLALARRLEQSGLPAIPWDLLPLDDCLVVFDTLAADGERTGRKLEQ